MAPMNKPMPSELRRAYQRLAYWAGVVRRLEGRPVDVADRNRRQKEPAPLRAAVTAGVDAAIGRVTRALATVGAVQAPYGRELEAALREFALAVRQSAVEP